MRNRTRVLIAGVTVGLMAGVSGVALAAGSSKPRNAPPIPASAGVHPAKEAAPGAALSDSRSGRTLLDADSSAKLATLLGISDAQAQNVLNQIEQLVRRDGSIEPTGSGFVAIAQWLRITPHRLASVLDQLKRDAATN